MKQQYKSTFGKLPVVFSVIGGFCSIVGVLFVLFTQLGLSTELTLGLSSSIFAGLVGAASVYVAKWIKYLPRKPRVFISYSHLNRPLAKEVAGALRSAGTEVWIDFEQLRHGQSIQEEIERGLSDADFFVAIITQEPTPMFRMELEKARERRLRIIPLIHKEGDVPSEVREIRYIDLRGNDNKWIDELREAVS